MDKRLYKIIKLNRENKTGNKAILMINKTLKDLDIIMKETKDHNQCIN